MTSFKFKYVSPKVVPVSVGEWTLAEAWADAVRNLPPHKVLEINFCSKATANLGRNSAYKAARSLNVNITTQTIGKTLYVRKVKA